MDLDAALTILRRPGALGPPTAQDVADALAAAGVLAARNADPGRLADLPADPGTDVAGAQRTRRPAQCAGRARVNRRSAATTKTAFP